MKLFQFVYLLCSLLFFNSIFGQKGTKIDDSYSFLKPVVKDASIVLLGEQTHGDGATLDEKIKIIKYLHENLGYNTIAFESGMYDHYRALRNYSQYDDLSIYDETMSEIYSDTQAIGNLIKYIDERVKVNDTIKLLGFDSQEGSVFNDNFIDDLKNLFEDHGLSIEKSSMLEYEKILVNKDVKIVANSKEDSIRVFKEFDKLLGLLDKIPNPGIHEKMMKQVIKSQISDVSFEIKLAQNQKIAVQNPRDLQMAENLIFLSQLYPDDKIICWGASYHFAKNIDKIKTTPLTEDYLTKLDSINKRVFGSSDGFKKGEGQDLLKGGVPMGVFIKKHFKEKAFTVAFSSYQGEYGQVDNPSIPILTPPENSIEEILVKDKGEKYFVNLNAKDTTSYYCSALGNIPFKANWNDIFDGLIFIKTSYPVIKRSYGKSTDIKAVKDLFNLKGKISNSKNDEAIPNAEIYLLNNNKRVMANQAGDFRVTIPRNLLDDKIVISAMGYLNDTINIIDLVKTKRKAHKFWLHIQNFDGITLNEVTVSSSDKDLTPEKIIENARKNIPLNYNQNAYNQKFFYNYLKTTENDSIVGHKAIVETFNANGMKGSNRPDKKIYGELEHFKSIGDIKDMNTIYDKLGQMALMFNRDVLLSKSNVLYRTDSYSLTREGIVDYDGKEVYKIGFVNESPNTYSTGYGYPAPIESAGLIYIDKDTYAILKYEHCVKRESFDSKDYPGNMVEQSHKIVYSYKQKTNNSYFLNHGQVTNKTMLTSKIDKTLQKEYITKREILSVHYRDYNISRIKQPLYSVSKPKNSQKIDSYWRRNIFILQDITLKLGLCE